MMITRVIEWSGLYRCRRYRVLYSGPTRYGPRAKLCTLDGRSTFWVPASAIRDLRPGPACEVCGIISGDVRSCYYGLLCPSCRCDCEADRPPRRSLRHVLSDLILHIFG